MLPFEVKFVLVWRLVGLVSSFLQTRYHLYMLVEEMNGIPHQLFIQNISSSMYLPVIAIFIHPQPRLPFLTFTLVK